MDLSRLQDIRSRGVRFVDVKQFAKLVNASTSHIYELCKKGELLFEDAIVDSKRIRQLIDLNSVQNSLPLPSLDKNPSVVPLTEVHRHLDDGASILAPTNVVVEQAPRVSSNIYTLIRFGTRPSGQQTQLYFDPELPHQTVLQLDGSAMLEVARGRSVLKMLTAGIVSKERVERVLSNVNAESVKELMREVVGKRFRLEIENEPSKNQMYSVIRKAELVSECSNEISPRP